MCPVDICGDNLEKKKKTFSEITLAVLLCIVCKYVSNGSLRKGYFFLWSLEVLSHLIKSPFTLSSPGLM